MQARADVSLPDICLACGSARVMCGGKIALAEPAGNFIYRVSCLLWR